MSFRSFSCRAARSVCLSLGLTFAARLAFAQSAPQADASIRGRVVDPVGQPVAQAQVVARNEATGAERGTVVDRDGRYVLRDLAGGRYTVRVRALGFQPA